MNNPNKYRFNLKKTAIWFLIYFAIFWLVSYFVLDLTTWGNIANAFMMTVIITIGNYFRDKESSKKADS